jgi:hypothetical protein
MAEMAEALILTGPRVGVPVDYSALRGYPSSTSGTGRRCRGTSSARCGWTSRTRATRSPRSAAVISA